MKLIQKIFLLTLITLGFIINIMPIEVNAKTAPSKVTLKTKSNMYYFSESKGTDYISGYNFYRKELTDGTLAYCVSNISEDVPSGKTLVLKEATTDKGLDYIIQNGYPNKSITGNNKKDYYITQAAIWKYFDETRGSKNWKNTTFSSDSTTMKKEVYNLVQAAKTFNSTGKYEEPTIEVLVDNTSMDLSSDFKYFVSKPIKVELKNAKSTYTVNLVNAPAGTIIKNTDGVTKTTFNSNESFVVYVPVSGKDSISGSVELTVTGEGVVYKTYTYTVNNSKYQDIAPSEAFEVVSKLVSGVLTLNYDKEPELTKVKISKQDITTKKELPGATLVVKDSNGNVVDTWVSTNEPHYLENLKAGKYTLTETIAPEGYTLSKETIEFTVQNDGKVETVIMYNDPITTKVKISKQDITTKKELPGATLVIKDSNGKEVEKWVSTNEPHYLESLKPGKYTLTETIAPNGYVLSEEVISFTVESTGEIQTVVMYNEKEPETTKVKISKKDMTTKEELPGATLVVKDSNGKEVEKWVSTNEPHYIENLKPGKYTLTETIAPEGYVLSSETIEFTVKKDGKIETVVMYNSKKPEATKVKISKQDITTKEELPGATLVIKDSNGEVVDTWVSTNTPYYIEGLEPGKYTLTETIAPEGYVLSSETIEFTVKETVEIQSVIMYNTPYTEVPITDLDINKTTMIVASILILLGTGVVFYYGKFSK